MSGFEVSALILLSQNLLSYFDTLNCNYEDEKIVSSFHPETYKGNHCLLTVCVTRNYDITC